MKKKKKSPALDLDDKGKKKKGHASRKIPADRLEAEFTEDAAAMREQVLTDFD